LRIVAVVKIVSIVVVDVEVIGSIPVVGPVLRPWIQQQERKPAVIETRIPLIDDRYRLQTKGVVKPEIEAEAVLRDVIPPIASALRPGAMFGGPPVGAIRLPGTVPLPAARL
jgi:hypothetical protein